MTAAADVAIAAEYIIVYVHTIYVILQIIVNELHEQSRGCKCSGFHIITPCLLAYYPYSRILPMHQHRIRTTAI